MALESAGADPARSNRTEPRASPRFLPNQLRRATIYRAAGTFRRALPIDDLDYSNQHEYHRALVKRRPTPGRDGHHGPVDRSDERRPALHIFTDEPDAIFPRRR